MISLLAFRREFAPRKPFCKRCSGFDPWTRLSTLAPGSRQPIVKVFFGPAMAGELSRRASGAY